MNVRRFIGLSAPAHSGELRATTWAAVVHRNIFGGPGPQRGYVDFSPPAVTNTRWVGICALNFQSRRNGGPKVVSPSQAVAVDPGQVKLCRKTNESLGDAPDIFFRRRSACGASERMRAISAAIAASSVTGWRMAMHSPERSCQVRSRNRPQSGRRVRRPSSRIRA